MFVELNGKEISYILESLKQSTKETTAFIANAYTTGYSEDAVNQERARLDFLWELTSKFENKRVYSKPEGSTGTVDPYENPKK